ncbi:MAG: hypothetical protein R3A78_01480 [Polyangiales bacterium]|nr:hypothetical protein [Myxococcales bacterium]
MTRDAESPFGRLALDRHAELGPAALRTVGAVAVTAGSAWLAVAVGSSLAWVVAGIGFLASLAWVGMARVARRRVASASAFALTLDPGGLTLAEPGKELQVRWTDVEDIAINEERLTVVVTHDGGHLLAIEPRFGGLGTHALHDRLLRARTEATTRAVDGGKP